MVKYRCDRSVRSNERRAGLTWPINLIESCGHRYSGHAEVGNNLEILKPSGRHATRSTRYRLSRFAILALLAWQETVTLSCPITVLSLESASF